MRLISRKEVLGTSPVEYSKVYLILNVSKAYFIIFCLGFPIVVSAITIWPVGLVRYLDPTCLSSWGYCNKIP